MRMEGNNKCHPNVPWDRMLTAAHANPAQTANPAHRLRDQRTQCVHRTIKIEVSPSPWPLLETEPSAQCVIHLTCSARCARTTPICPARSHYNMGALSACLHSYVHAHPSQSSLPLSSVATHTPSTSRTPTLERTYYGASHIPWPSVQVRLLARPTLSPSLVTLCIYFLIEFGRFVY